MTITFEQIGNFISANLMWFLIPINILIIIALVYLIYKVISAKKRRKYERKRQNKLSRTNKKTYSL